MSRTTPRPERREWNVKHYFDDCTRNDHLTWADWMLSLGTDEVGESFFRADSPDGVEGTVSERALYAYLLHYSGEPF